MCDTDGCNTTQLCDLAKKSVRNFDLKKCNASCCERDLCNAIGIPKITNELNVQTGYVKPDYDDDDDEDDDDDYSTLATGPSCFECKEGTDFHTCDLVPNVVRCGLEYNSCFSITGSLSSQSDELVTHRGCGLEIIDCNVTQLCIDTRNKLFVNQDLELKTCNGYCCKGDFCNSFNPTRPANELGKSSSLGTRARRTAKRSERSHPMKCYECKPDSFSSMCKRNTTERSCVTGSDGYDGCFTMTATIINSTTGEVRQTLRTQAYGCPQYDVLSELRGNLVTSMLRNIEKTH
ncbi:hypothetical protein QZH41_004837 [Actinostola sp. cb2023]|nr:hypothetical protein QZH41_004837 [Actinostola sp. cb2023]